MLGLQSISAIDGRVGSPSINISVKKKSEVIQDILHHIWEGDLLQSIYPPPPPIVCITPLYPIIHENFKAVIGTTLSVDLITNLIYKLNMRKLSAPLNVKNVVLQGGVGGGQGGGLEEPPQEVASNDRTDTPLLCKLLFPHNMHINSLLSISLKLLYNSFSV